MSGIVDSRSQSWLEAKRRRKRGKQRKQSK